MKIFILISILLLSQISQAKAKNLRALIDELFQKNSLLKSSQQMKVVSKFQYKKSLSQFFPKINLTSSYLKRTDYQLDFQNFDPTNPRPQEKELIKPMYSMHFELTQPIFLGGKLLAGRKIAKIGTSLSDQVYRKQKNQILFQLIQTAYHLAFLEEQRKVLQSSKESYKKLVRINKRKLNTGNALSYEYHQSKAELFSYESRLKSLEQNNKQTQERLKQLLESQEIPQVSIDLPTPFLESEVDKLIKISFEDLFQRSQKANQDYILAKKNLEKTQSEKLLAMSDYYPKIAFSYRQGYSNEDTGSLFSDESKDKQFGFSLTVPLFSGFSSTHERKIQSAQIFRAEKNLRHQILSLESKVRSEKKNLKLAKEIVEESKKWLSSANKSYKDAEKQFRNGRINTFQIVQIQGLKERATLSYLQSLEALYGKLLAFQITLGDSLETIYGGKEYDQ